MENIAYVEWSLNVECPKCKLDNDLARSIHDGGNDIARHIFNNEWDVLKGWEITCEHCKFEFLLDDIIY